MKLIWRRGARQDLEDIAAYLGQHNQNAALWVVQRIEKRISDLEFFPDAGRAGRGVVRELVITRTRYIALYRKLDDRVEIIRIAHGARDR